MERIAKYKLSELSLIRTGVTLRNTIQSDSTGDIVVFQPRDIQNGEFTDNPSYIDSKQINNLNRHTLQKGDLLIANKGLKFGVFLFKNELNKSIASGSFFVIKPDLKKCIPEYLEWFLTQPSTKNYLLRNSSTVTIPTLPKTVLDKLEIVLPPLPIQTKIINMLTVIRKEQNILKKLIEKTEEYKDSYIWELIESNK